MDVTSAFRLSSLFLACAAFAGLALTAALPPGFLFLGFGSLLAALVAFAMGPSRLAQPSAHRLDTDVGLFRSL